VKCFLAGWQASNTARETRAIKAGVIKNRCFSFANMVKVPGLPFHLPGTEQGYHACVKHKVGIMMDSGVISYRTHREYLLRSGKGLGSLPEADDYIRMYVEYCKEFAHLWDFYVTIDFGIVAKDNFERHIKLEKMGIRPMPVFHGDDTEEYLRRYADRGYTYIGIGTSKIQHRTTVFKKRQYLDTVFNAGVKYGLEFHGLAMTAPWIMLDYSWRSVDSSSWSRTAGYGCILRFDPDTDRISILHVSDRDSSAGKLHLNGGAMKRVQRELESEGYDFHEIQTDHTVRHIYNAATMLKLAAAAEARHSVGHWGVFV
jgi:hypothetical protein